MIDLLVEDNVSFKVMTLPYFITRSATSWDERKVCSPVQVIERSSIAGLPIAESSSDSMLTLQARIRDLVLTDWEAHGITVAHAFEEQFGNEPLNEMSDSDTDKEDDK